MLIDDLGLSQHLCCGLFPIKYIKYDSMVNKEYIYIYNVCERESMEKLLLSFQSEGL